MRIQQEARYRYARKLKRVEFEETQKAYPDDHWSIAKMLRTNERYILSKVNGRGAWEDLGSNCEPPLSRLLDCIPGSDPVLQLQMCNANTDWSVEKGFLPTDMCYCICRISHIQFRASAKNREQKLNIFKPYITYVCQKCHIYFLHAYCLEKLPDEHFYYFRSRIRNIFGHHMTLNKSSYFFGKEK